MILLDYAPSDPRRRGRVYVPDVGVRRVQVAELSVRYLRHRLRPGGSPEQDAVALWRVVAEFLGDTDPLVAAGQTLTQAAWDYVRRWAAVAEQSTITTGPSGGEEVIAQTLTQLRLFDLYWEVCESATTVDPAPTPAPTPAPNPASNPARARVPAASSGAPGSVRTAQTVRVATQRRPG